MSPTWNVGGMPLVRPAQMYFAKCTIGAETSNASTSRPLLASCSESVPVPQPASSAVWPPLPAIHSTAVCSARS